MELDLHPDDWVDIYKHGPEHAKEIMWWIDRDRKNDDIDPDDVPGVAPLDGEPYAEIEQTHRFVFWIKVHHGVIIWGPDGGPFLYIGTAAGAERKAERLIDKYYDTHDELNKNVWTVY